MSAHDEGERVKVDVTLRQVPRVDDAVSSKETPIRVWKLER
jgi:hypothetical protein